MLNALILTIGLALAILGATLLIFAARIGSEAAGHARVIWWACIAVFVAAVCTVYVSTQAL